ncbi:hypothetical protein E2C01_096435 [Portunus trituberculatus]|uniref:Uncharacterized protein n=1 Tax=Portunus trituberculatus TaxID=210409 RepID=A0A5B7K6Z9_PORTR|nr:hypothetical protein [Portunus trituberculatus]
MEAWLTGKIDCKQYHLGVSTHLDPNAFLLSALTRPLNHSGWPRGHYNRHFASTPSPTSAPPDRQWSENNTALPRVSHLGEQVSVGQADGWM